MLLEIDAGNTRGKWRLRDGGEIRKSGCFYVKDAIEKEVTEFLENSGLHSESIDRVLISSVLDAEHNNLLVHLLEKKLGIIPDVACSESHWNNLRNGYHVPEKLGTDRWLGMIAAYSEFKQSCIVIDCGSAITVDAIDCDGGHLGGFIVPGFSMMQRSLFCNTHRVKVTLPEDISIYRNEPGRDTRSAIISARFAILNGLIASAGAALTANGNHNVPAIIVTGGDAAYVTQIREEAILRPDLVMDGLGLFFNNR